MQNLIRSYFTESIQAQIVAVESLAEVIEAAVNLLVNVLLEGGKILCCGGGNFAALSQNFVSKFINQFETERPSLPAISLNANNVLLSSIAESHHIDDAFSKQINALGNENDVLFVLFGADLNPSILKAIETAVRRNIKIIALFGGENDLLTGLLDKNDVGIRIPSKQSSRIEETQIIVLNCLCNLVDQALFLS